MQLMDARGTLLELKVCRLRVMSVLLAMLVLNSTNIAITMMHDHLLNARDFFWMLYMQCIDK